MNQQNFNEHHAWISWLNNKLPKPQPLPSNAPIVLDLFAGCGGLALGFEVAGFRTYGFEMKPEAVATYNKNLEGNCQEVLLSIGLPEGKADIIIGGPPCQPFSQIGYQKGKRDIRDGFPIFLDAVNRLRPKIAIIENVRGLLFRNKDYLRQAIQELERFGYNVDAKLLKAIEYGVPQKRERVIVVASILGNWDWPKPLVTEAVTTGTALGELALTSTSDSKFLTPNMDRYIAEYEKKSHCINPRDLHLDQPSRTVTCRNLGGATADMLRIKLSDGRRRMLTVPEAARLQSFPDWFEFEGTQYQQFEQIGNAVAPLMALAIAQEAKKLLDSSVTKNVINIDVDIKQSSLSNIDPIAEKKEQALKIIQAVGISIRDLKTTRRKERLALALLAVVRLVPEATSWQDANSFLVATTTPGMTTEDIIDFWHTHYKETLSSSSSDDVRRKDLTFLVQEGLIVLNDETSGYAIEKDFLKLLKAFDTNDWAQELQHFRNKRPQIQDRLSRSK